MTITDTGTEPLLYTPVPQIQGEPDMVVKWMMVTPEMATEWLRIADAEQGFRQRPIKVRAVVRWKILMETERFVNYLPNGPLCFDDQGLLLNGRHRLTALAGQKKSFGFMVVENAPRFMFSFFDTGLPRTLNDVFHIAGHPTRAQLGSAMRLAMRFEETVYEKRSIYGWKEWGAHRDEHSDVEQFMTRRIDLADWYLVGQQIYRGAKIIIASGMVFRFYQTLAWPEGDEHIVDFCESLAKGSMLAANSPTLVLREWARNEQDQMLRIRGKRELHLLLLLRHFSAQMQGKSMPKATWANGFPMALPYHPKGPETAKENIITALHRIDKEAEAQQV